MPTEHEVIAQLGGIIDSLNAQVEELERDRERLARALEVYGRHRIDCRFLTGPCTCGLDEALEERR